MPRRKTLALMQELVERPSTFWPGSDRFHARNRYKIERSVAAIWSSLQPRQYVQRLVDIIDQRNNAGVVNLLAMSNGSSGSHYLGELLNEFPRFHMTDEVYFPPAYLDEVQSSGDPDAWMALEFLDLVHTGHIDDDLTETAVVNIGHLRPDARPEDLRGLGYRPKFLLLLRNPFDVALGRAFRKDEYRSEVDPTASDEQYLRKQASYTANFLNRAKQERWDVVVRYERLTTDPIGVLCDLGLTLGEVWPVPDIERALEKYDPNRGSRVSLSANLNTRPRPSVAPSHAAILDEAMSEVASEFGYEPPNRVAKALCRPSTKANLLLPLYAEESQYNAVRFRAFGEGRIKVFRSQPETRLEDDPEWSADPLGSMTWRLYYHSLAWLLALTWGADHDADRSETLSEIRKVVFSYLDANVFSAPADEMAWDDHATADRLSILSHLRVHYLEPDLDPQDGQRLVEAMGVHVDRIVSFYNSRRWIGSNHGLFHAIALLNAGLAIPKSEWSVRASEMGQQYLSEVIERMVDPSDGVSLEQSAAYHSINLMILRSVAIFLRENAMAGADRLAEIIGLMVEFNLALRGTNNHRIALGDTPFGDTIPQSALVPQHGEAQTDRTKYILTRGKHGTPFPKLLVYRSVGWALFRDEEVFEGNEEVTRAVFTFSESRGPHGHFDALSFALQHLGRDILIDSGGPFSYGDPLRFMYFASPRGHNTVLVGGHDHQGGAEYVASGEVGTATYVIAQHKAYPEVTLMRAVIHVAERGFVIVDASTESDEDLEFETLWHLAPETTTSHMKASKPLRLVTGEISTEMQFWSCSPIELEKRTGDHGGKPTGWVTTAVDTKREADTLAVATKSSKLFSVTTISIDESDIDVEMLSQSCRIFSAGGEALTISLEGDKLTLRPLRTGP